MLIHRTKLFSSPFYLHELNLKPLKVFFLSKHCRLAKTFVELDYDYLLYAVTLYLKSVSSISGSNKWFVYLFLCVAIYGKELADLVYYTLYTNSKMCMPIKRWIELLVLLRLIVVNFIWYDMRVISLNKWRRRSWSLFVCITF